MNCRRINTEPVMDGVDAVLYVYVRLLFTYTYIIQYIQYIHILYILYCILYLAQKKTDTSINHCDSSHRDRLGFYAEIIFLTVKLNS